MAEDAFAGFLNEQVEHVACPSAGECRSDSHCAGICSRGLSGSVSFLKILPEGWLGGGGVLSSSLWFPIPQTQAGNRGSGSLMETDPGYPVLFT